MIHLVVPVRAKSQRIPEKIFSKIQGRELILRMAEHARYFQEEIMELHAHMAVDDERALRLLKEQGGGVTVHMTDPALASGTDRVCEVYKRIRDQNPNPADWVVNVQGDMPFLSRATLAKFLNQLKLIPESFGMATMAESFQSIADYESRGVVKVIVCQDKRSLYFSRFPIPYGREALPSDPKKLIAHSHIGVYAYRPATLLRLSSLPAHPVELAEGLEQLRALEAGIQIHVFSADSEVGTSFRGIDLPSDMEWAQNFRSADNAKI